MGEGSSRSTCKIVGGYSFVAFYFFRIFTSEREKRMFLGGKRSLEFYLALAYFRWDLHRATFRDKKTKPEEACTHHVTATGVLKYISSCINCGLIDISPQFRLWPYAILFSSIRATMRAFLLHVFFFCEFIPFRFVPPNFQFLLPPKIIRDMKYFSVIFSHIRTSKRMLKILCLRLICGIALTDSITLNFIYNKKELCEARDLFWFLKCIREKERSLKHTKLACKLDGENQEQKEYNALVEAVYHPA